MSRLAEALVGQGVLNAEQLRYCEGTKVQSGRGLGAEAILQGYATGRQRLEMLGAPGDVIDDFVPEGLEPALAVLVPGELALQLRCLPVHDNGTVLSVAFANEFVDHIAIRAGFHCAEPLHKLYNLPGTARISIGMYNTKDDIDGAVVAIKKTAKIFSM